MVIISAKSTPYFKNDEPYVNPLKARDNPEKQQENKKRIENTQNALSDNLELSNSVVAFLESVDKNMRHLLEQYPEYEVLLVGDSARQPLSSIHNATTFLSKTTFFLNDPQIQGLAKNDAAFKNFYEEVSQLALYHQQALKEIQRELRSTQNGNYYTQFRR